MFLSLRPLATRKSFTKLPVVITAFPWPAEFSLEKYCSGGDFGISHGRNVRLCFRIDKACGQHLLESPLANDQIALDLGDQLEITATVADTELLHRWLRGWGDKIGSMKITPLSP